MHPYDIGPDTEAYYCHDNDLHDEWRLAAALPEFRKRNDPPAPPDIGVREPRRPLVPSLTGALVPGNI